MYTASIKHICLKKPLCIKKSLCLYLLVVMHQSSLCLNRVRRLYAPIVSMSQSCQTSLCLNLINKSLCLKRLYASSVSMSQSCQTYQSNLCLFVPTENQWTMTIIFFSDHSLQYIHVDTKQHILTTSAPRNARSGPETLFHAETCFF